MAELNEKFHHLDSTANAAVLYSERNSFIEYTTEFGFEVIDQYKIRIKIYNNEGLVWANHKINFFTNIRGQQEVIVSLKAATYNQLNDKIVKTKLEKKHIYKTKITKFHRTISFTMPNVYPGSVIEYKYTKRSPFFGNIDDIIIQRNIPVKHTKTLFKISNKITYNFISRGSLKIPIIHNGHTTSMLMTDVPALKEEGFVGNISNYQLGVRLELVSTQINNLLRKNYTGSWTSIAKDIYKSKYFGGQLTKKTFFKDKLKILKDNSISEKDLANKIFKFIKNKITWNNVNSYFSYTGIEKSFKEGVGNTADINLALLAMLNEAGLEAYPVLISTVSHGIPLFPSKDGFNYVIVAYKTNNEILLMDATDKKTRVGVLPERDLNVRGWLIYPDATSEWINLFPSKYSIIKTNTDVIINDSRVNANMVRSRSNNFALKYRKEVEAKNLEEIASWIEEKNSDVNVVKIRVNNINLPDRDITEYIRFDTQSYHEVIGRELYFSPLLFMQLSENPFKSEKRNHPIFYNFPRIHHDIVTLIIPTNYSIKSLPKPLKIEIRNNKGNYQYTITQNGNLIKIESKMAINLPVFPKEDYLELKSFYKQILVKQAEKIVLVRN